MKVLIRSPRYLEKISKENISKWRDLIQKYRVITNRELEPFIIDISDSEMEEDENKKNEEDQDFDESDNELYVLRYVMGDEDITGELNDELEGWWILENQDI